MVGSAQRWIRGSAGMGFRARGVSVEEAVLSHSVVSRRGSCRDSRGSGRGAGHRKRRRERGRRQCDARCRPERLSGSRRDGPKPRRPTCASTRVRGGARDGAGDGNSTCDVVGPQHGRIIIAACELQRHVQPRQRSDQLQPGIRAAGSGLVCRKQLRRGHGQLCVHRVQVEWGDRQRTVQYQRAFR